MDLDRDLEFVRTVYSERDPVKPGRPGTGGGCICRSGLAGGRGVLENAANPAGGGIWTSILGRLAASSCALRHLICLVCPMDPICD